MTSLIKLAFALLGLFALIAGAWTVHARTPSNAHGEGVEGPVATAALTIEVAREDGSAPSDADLARAIAALSGRLDGLATVERAAEDDTASPRLSVTPLEGAEVPHARLLHLATDAGGLRVTALDAGAGGTVLDETAIQEIRTLQERAALELVIAPARRGTLESLTRRLIGRRLAVDVGTIRVNSPVVQMPLSASLLVNGGLDTLDAERLRDLRALIERPLRGLTLVAVDR